MSGDGTITIGITYDKNGKEKTMTVLGVGNVSAAWTSPAARTASAAC